MALAFFTWQNRTSVFRQDNPQLYLGSGDGGVELQLECLLKRMGIRYTQIRVLISSIVLTKSSKSDRT